MSRGDGIRPLRPLEIPLAPYEYGNAPREMLSGTLMYEGECLLFRNEDGSVPIEPIWPTGSTFNGTAVLFHEPGRADQRLMIAEQIVLEGRALQWSELSADTYLPFQRQCAAQPFLVTSVGPAN